MVVLGVLLLASELQLENHSMWALRQVLALVIVLGLMSSPLQMNHELNGLLEMMFAGLCPPEDNQIVDFPNQVQNFLD